MSLITMADYARSRKERGLPGGTKAGVLKAVRAGRLVLVNGKVDADAADAQWDANTNRKQQRAVGSTTPNITERPDTETPSETFSQAQTRKEIALANLREDEVRENQRELVRRKDVIRLHGDMIVTAKTNLRGVGSKLAADLAAETSAAQCQAMVDHEIDAALREISQWTPA